ncbi:hypothetical protein U8527_09935 [Kordia algicida OT-1]|uniref:Uncharacterized protein n=1 Tax=Kordia algicida OT-1 TaxID=391587 RepID=A9DVH5_9FLAO|nr:hypothetical protein [Kordia algicida]EDP96422.1 hypothetical protein KAOT1_03397 [Kordia algicida OT-1]
MDRKFESLLKNNRNWLSKYGGLISVCIIGLLIYGVFQIRIPKYELVEIVEKNTVSIPAETAPKLTKGAILEVQNVAGEEIALTVVSSESKNDKNYIKYTATETLAADTQYKIIIAEHSLLKSISGSLMRK